MISAANLSPGPSETVLPRNFLPFWVLLAISVALASGLVAQFISPALVLETMGVCVVLIMVPVRWPYGALGVLLAASLMPRFTISIGGWNARPEHYAIALIVVWLLLRRVFAGSQGVPLIGADYCIAAYILWNYVSSVLASPDPKQTLRWALLNNLAILPYFIIRVLAVNRTVLEWLFKVFVLTGIIESGYAILAFVCHHLIGSTFGVEVDQYAAGLGGIYGTQYEPNLLGSYCACLAIILIVLYFANVSRSRWLIAGIVVALAAMLFSLARAALLSFVLISVFLLVWGLLCGKLRLGAVLPLLIILCLLLVPVAVLGGKNVAARFSNWSEEGLQADTDTMGRFVAWSAAIQNIAEHPIVGNGTASFQLVADARELPILGNRPWVGNSAIRILHDTGIIGLALFGLVIIAFGKQVRRVTKFHQRGTEWIVALSAGCLIYALAFLSTDGTMLGFFWVHLGLLASACVFFKPTLSASTVRTAVSLGSSFSTY